MFDAELYRFALRPSLRYYKIMNAELQDLGLVPFFSQQLSFEELENCHLVRVVEVQRSGISVSDGVDEWAVVLGGVWQRAPATERPTVGDWVLLDSDRAKVQRVLERKSLFRRVAAGDKLDVQPIAANIDTLFIVTSCNEEFKESRLERYLALAVEAEVSPVVVLTKTDLANDPESYAARARTVKPGIAVEAINALDSLTFDGLNAWVTRGSTIALVGSSGVGKSTLVNSLLGAKRTATGGIREQDAKGRHTTSYRAMHRLPNGGLLIDVPGMRELKVAEVEAALNTVFEDIDAIAKRCRFKNCSHESEPDCAVRAAIEAGDIDVRRWENYSKLLREDARFSRSLAEQHSRMRKFGKEIKQTMALKRELKEKR